MDTRSEDYKPDHSEQSFKKVFLLLLLENFSPVPIVLLHLRTITSHSGKKLEYCMSKIYLVLERFKIFLHNFVCRHEKCSKFCTTQLPGKKISQRKMHKSRLFSLKIKQLKCINMWSFLGG